MRREITSRIYKCPFITVIHAEKSIMKTKACVSTIYAARLRRYRHFLRISLHSTLLHPEIPLVSGGSFFSIITAVLLIDAEMCVSTVAFKYRWEE